MLSTRALAAVSLVGFLAVTPTLANQPQPVIEVKVDRAKVMRVSRPASMIIIGNTAIADATIKDSQTLIITGKQFGTTNLIVLDSSGEPIADEVLNVTSSQDNNLVVYKGTARSTYTCSPNCAQVMRIGDAAQPQSDLAKQIERHKQMSRGEQVDLGDSE